YGRAELLRLQQILFHRQLGMSLDEIRQTLDAPHFDRAQALRDHRQALLRQTELLEQLVATIDATLVELSGGKRMTDAEIYKGIDAWVVERYGAAARWGIDTRNKATANWSEDERRDHAAARRAIFDDFAAASARGLAPESDETQAIARRLYESAGA